MIIFEPANIVCPRCGNANYMRHIIGENVGRLDLKCINCNSYFNFGELFDQMKETKPKNEVGVCITDMKMPKNCGECQLESYCSLWTEVIGKEYMHPDCPLVPMTATTGHWIEVDQCMTICSECNGIGCGSRYCPNCGAKMMEES